MRPERLAELKEERRFLLRSLVDLDAEHAAGDVDADDYASLKDGYTARAAAVLREIEAGTAPKPSRGRSRRGVIAAWVAGVLVVAAGAGWLVARSSGQRLPGQSITGGQEVDALTAQLSAARAATSANDLPTAIAAYEAALEIEPDNVEALTYRTWLTVLSARSAGDDAAAATAVDAALVELATITDAHPDYADAHCLYAVAAGRFAAEPDLDLAKAQGELCLASDPPAEMVQLIQSFLGSLDLDTGSGTETTVPATLPDDLEGLLDAGLAALNAGDAGRAAEAYQAALDIDPVNAEARTYLAWLLALSAQGASEAAASVALDQAVSSFETVIADQPDYPDAHCLYAVTAVELFADPDVELGAEQAAACRALDPSDDMEALLTDYVDPMVDALGLGS